MAQQLAHDLVHVTKTFTSVHGEALVLTMRRLGVANDDDLPPIHNLLIKTHKSQQYSVLGGAFAAPSKKRNISK
jgi:hypothetical protein